MARVLLIEDEPQVCNTISGMLDKYGHRVTTANDGAEGLATLRRTEFDVIVADIFLPTCDGLEVISRLRNAGREIPIVAISGGGNTHYVDILKHAEAFGADVTLAKPFRADEIAAAVDAALARLTTA